MRLPILRSLRIACVGTGIICPRSCFHMSKTTQNALLGCCVGRKATSAGTHAQIGENSRFQHGDLEDGVFICADSCSSSAIAAAYIYTPFYRLLPVDGPYLREFGALDALAMPNSCWGCSLSCIPTEHQKPMRCRFDLCSRSRSVDTYLAAGLDASLLMVASWPEMGGGLPRRGESCLLIVGRTERSGRLSHLRIRQREKQHRFSIWLALTVQFLSRHRWEM